MQDLKDVTQDVHYENFRLQKIKTGGEVAPVNGYVLRSEGILTCDHTL